MIITRAELRAAIEAGIANSAYAEAANERLRKTGETIPRVAVGLFYSKGGSCGCPLAAAGLVTDDGTVTLTGRMEGLKDEWSVDASTPRAFASAFDRAADDAAVSGGNDSLVSYVEVIE